MAGLNRGEAKRAIRKKNCLDSLGLTSSDHLGYVWSESLREYVNTENKEEKLKNKIKFKSINYFYILL